MLNTYLSDPDSEYELRELRAQLFILHAMAETYIDYHGPEDDPYSFNELAARLEEDDEYNTLCGHIQDLQDTIMTYARHDCTLDSYCRPGACADFIPF